MMITGIDLYTIHQNSDGLRNETPGFYAVLENGVSFGALYNSHARLSVWAGYSIETNTLTISKIPVSAGLIVGGITGYKAAPVLPLLLPSIKIWNIRASYIMKTKENQGSAIHFSYEFKF